MFREDLAKPAQTLFLHNLTGILESAIRATNAQYDDADILKRLDVRLLEVVIISDLFHHCAFTYMSVGDMAQWLERQSLAGALSLIYG